PATGDAGLHGCSGYIDAGRNCIEQGRPADAHRPDRGGHRRAIGEDAMSIGDWTQRFQGTSNLPRHVRDRLLQFANVRRIAKGEQVFGPKYVPDNLLFLYDGTIRVSQSSDNGREIVLYRVEAGESCVLTTACMLAEEAYNAEGTAETDVTIVSLPKLALDQLAGEESAFRNFVFAAYSRRLLDLLRVVDDVAFGRMDVRLADRLLTLAAGYREI